MPLGNKKKSRETLYEIIKTYNFGYIARDKILHCGSRYEKKL